MQRKIIENIGSVLDEKSIKMLYDLKELILEKSFISGDFTLSSGVKSSYYVDLKKATFDPKGINLISNIILNNLQKWFPDRIINSIGGMEVGAIPIISAITA